MDVEKIKQTSTIGDRKFWFRNQGITLIALVVTIVVLLILAGITINLLFADTGIFNKAQESEDAYKIGVLRDQISTIILNWELEKRIPNTTGDETIGTLDRLWDKFVDADIIDNPDEDIYHHEGTDIYDVTTNEGYVVEIIVKEDGTVEIGDIVKGDSLPPRIGEIASSGTSSSIHVEVSITRSTGEVKLSYYYKKDGEPEENYIPLKENVADLTADFTGLEQNVIYNIKVVVTDDNGSTEKVINQLTGELAEGTIRQVGDPEWSNGTATIRLETSETGVDIVYQVGNIDGTWLPYPEGGISGLNHGDIVYAAISDGTNVSKEGSFEIEDGIAPTVTVSQGTITTNSIAVNVSSKDDQWGMSTSPTYNYYIKESTAGSYPTSPNYTGTNINYTFTGLTQGTSYDVRVTTQDKAGNPGTGTLANQTTGTVGGATGGLVEGNIIASNPTWSSGTASITLSKGSSVASNLSIQWQINSIDAGGWTTGESVTGLNHNDTVYARLTDGINAGSEASITIKDGTAPQQATITLSNTNVTTGATVTATVTHTDNESGPEITKCKYIWNTSSTNIGTDSSLYTGGTFSSNGQQISQTMSTKGTYYLHVLTVDKGGNVLETVSSAITVRQLATGVSISPTSVTLEEGQTRQLTATVTPTTADNRSVTWSSSNSTVATVSSSGLVTAKTAGNATITATTKDGSNKKATCSITVKYPTVENKLEEGDHVNYIDKSGVTRECIVLYDSSSEYGTQIITEDIIVTIELGNGTGNNSTNYDSTEFDIAMNSYNNAISRLNEKAATYLNTTYASDARSVGSIPNNKDAQADGYFTSGRNYMESYNGKFRDTDSNYETDYEQMRTLNITAANESYWLASRYVSSTPSGITFEIRRISSTGAYGIDTACCVMSENIYSRSYIHGLRPVFTLKPEVKVTGGNGTESNPYTLGT